MTNHAFVTGASGFLGINLIAKLCQGGWKVTALHRPNSTTRYLDRFDVIKRVGRIDDLESLRKAMPENVDVVYHLAANTGTWAKLNQQQYQDNVVGTRNMIQCAADKKVGKFIHTSSIAAFGFHPQPINEDTPSTAYESGINYFITKYQAELEIKAAVQQGLDAIIINPANILGPYDARNWVQLFKAIHQNRLPGIPPAKGMFCWVEDVAQAHISAAEKGKSGENYLIGGVQASYLDVTHQIQSLMNRPLSMSTKSAWMLHLATYLYIIRPWFDTKEPLLTPEKTSMLTHDMLCDDSKAQRELNLGKTSLNEMVTRTYDWLVRESIIQ